MLALDYHGGWRVYVGVRLRAYLNPGALCDPGWFIGRPDASRRRRRRFPRLFRPVTVVGGCPFSFPSALNDLRCTVVSQLPELARVERRIPESTARARPRRPSSRQRPSYSVFRVFD